MTPLFPTKKFVDAKATCHKQMGLRDLSRQPRQYTDGFKPLLRDSVLATKRKAILLGLATTTLPLAVIGQPSRGITEATPKV